MIERIVDWIIEKQVKKQLIICEEVSIYKYGYILMCEIFLNIILALVIGIIMNSVQMVLFFLCMYIPLRSFCGGWHARKIWQCTFISNFILVIEVIGFECIIQYLSITVLLFIFMICIGIIICIAPVDTKTKKISQVEKQIYKKKIYLIIAIHVVLMAVMMQLKVEKFIFVIVYVYIIQVIMLVAGKIKRSLLLNNLKKQ